jgi:transcriptional regulator with XRE-family HTH domain
MSSITVHKNIKIVIADMKHPEAPLMSAERLLQVEQLGTRIARLRQARRVRQADAAARAGMSRSTAALIEKGDPGRTLGQVLRYLDAIAPGATLLSLLQGTDPSLLALEASERVKRVRSTAIRELNDLNF